MTAAEKSITEAAAISAWASAAAVSWIQLSSGAPKSIHSSGEYQSGRGSIPPARKRFSRTKIEAIFRSCTVLPSRPWTGSGPIAPAVPVRPEKSAELSTTPPPMKEPMKK